MDKTLLRQHIAHKRIQLSQDFQDEAAINITTTLIRTNRFRHSRHIAFYLPVRNEADPKRILHHALLHHKFCYLPVLHPRKFHTLWFVRYEFGDKLYPNRYGIWEPHTDARKRRAAQRLDLIVLPVVAFDPLCHRLGTGGGFYDRTLHFLNHRIYHQKPYLVGIAYEFQRVEQLERAPHDVVLNEIITEKNHYRRILS